jgi:regulator of extracellular matrix RemA (YlzA/DUF370 family)
VLLSSVQPETITMRFMASYDRRDDEQPEKADK